MRSKNRDGRGQCAIYVLTLLALAIFVDQGNAGLLDQVRTDVRDGSSNSSKSDREESSEHDHYDCDDDDDDGFVATICGHTLTFPWWGPHAALGDNFSVESSFPRFPYDNALGYMLIGDSLPKYNMGEFNDDVSWQSPGRRWAGRVRFEYADEFDDITHTSGHLLLSTTSRFGLDTEASYLREELSPSGVDKLSLGDCNVVFRFAQNEFAQFRAGLGFNWLDDPIDTSYGFNFTYGADFFPVKPWIVSSAIDWGTLGDAGLFRFRLTTGVVLNRYEVYAGYEYLNIAGSEIGSLTSGVRVWF